MITGLGTDVVEIDRIRAACERYGERFLERVLSPREREEATGMTPARRAEFVAGRFAAKEALAKACGWGLGRLHMASVDIRLGPTGLEVRWLDEPAAQALGEDRWHLSISHTRTMAMAVAIREREA